MTTVSGPWSEATVSAFLAEAVQPLRMACQTPTGRLWLVTLWFTPRDGQLLCATGRDADVVEFLEANPHVAFEVSTNEVPYRGVRGNGQVTVEPDEDRALLRALLDRYLGGTDSRLADRLLSTDREEVRLVVDPDRLVSWDYSERMADV